MKDYQNPALDIDRRVEDLLNRMTLEEMILQTDQYYGLSLIHISEPTRPY